MRDGPSTPPLCSALDGPLAARARSEGRRIACAHPVQGLGLARSSAFAAALCLCSLQANHLRLQSDFSDSPGYHLYRSGQGALNFSSSRFGLDVQWCLSWIDMDQPEQSQSRSWLVCTATSCLPGLEPFDLAEPSDEEMPRPMRQSMLPLPPGSPLPEAEIESALSCAAKAWIIQAAPFISSALSHPLLLARREAALLRRSAGKASPRKTSPAL